MASRTAELVKECKRQFENCLYSSTSLFIWLRILRTLRIGFATLPIIFSALATWKFLAGTDDPKTKALVAVCTLIAGLLPMISAALKIEKQIEQAQGAATEYNNLRDRFRQAANIWSKKHGDEFEAEFQRLMAKMEAVRKIGLTPPEFVFKFAQEKVNSEDYSFDLDAPDETTADAKQKAPAELPKASPAVRVATEKEAGGSIAPDSDDGDEAEQALTSPNRMPRSH